MSRCSFWVSLVCGLSLALAPWAYLAGVCEWADLGLPVLCWFLLGLGSTIWRRSTEPKEESGNEPGR
jgi:hypothetical protein